MSRYRCRNRYFRLNIFVLNFDLFLRRKFFFLLITGAQVLLWSIRKGATVFLCCSVRRSTLQPIFLVQHSVRQETHEEVFIPFFYDSPNNVVYFPLVPPVLVGGLRCFWSPVLSQVFFHSRGDWVPAVPAASLVPSWSWRLAAEADGADE